MSKTKFSDDFKRDAILQITERGIAPLRADFCGPHNPVREQGVERQAEQLSSDTGSIVAPTKSK